MIARTVPIARRYHPTSARTPRATSSAVARSRDSDDREADHRVCLAPGVARGIDHRPLGPLTLHVGGTLSTVSSGAPFSERLHFEGNRDLRGYAPGALGPFDPQTGMSLGGNLKYTARGELEVPLSRRYGISAVGWVDVGGILAQGTRWSGASAGVGLAWRSPIGLVRLDYAIPLDGSPPALVFGLGGTW